MRVVATFALSGSNEFTCSRAEQTLSTTSSLPTHSFFGSVDGPPFVYLEPITKQPFSADRFWSLVLIQWSVFQSTARTILSSVNHYLSGNQISPLSTHQRQSSISIPHAGRVAPRIPLPALNPSSNVRRPQRIRDSSYQQRIFAGLAIFIPELPSIIRYANNERSCFW